MAKKTTRKPQAQAQAPQGVKVFVLTEGDFEGGFTTCLGVFASEELARRYLRFKLGGEPQAHKLDGFILAGTGDSYERYKFDSVDCELMLESASIQTTPKQELLAWEQDQAQAKELPLLNPPQPNPQCGNCRGLHRTEGCPLGEEIDIEPSFALLFPPNAKPESWFSDTPNDGILLDWGENKGKFNCNISEHFTDYHGGFLFDGDEWENTIDEHDKYDPQNETYQAAYQALWEISRYGAKGKITSPAQVAAMLQALKGLGWFEVQQHDWERKGVKTPYYWVRVADLKNGKVKNKKRYPDDKAFLAQYGDDE